MRRTTTAAKVLLVGLVVTLLSAGTIFAASQGGSQGNTNKGITIQVNPASRSVDQGDSVTYTLSLTSNNGFSGSVIPSISGLPASTTAAFAPALVTLASGKTAAATLTVTTSATTPDGKADLSVGGSLPATAGVSQPTAVVVQLQVKAANKTFSISGNLGTQLAPGATVPLNLAIANPNNKSVALNSLSVSIAAINRTPAAVAAGLPCTTADYVVTDYSGQYPLNVPVGSSTLQSIGIVPALWPQIAMLDTTKNQDGCKGATLQFAYSGAGEGS